MINDINLDIGDIEQIIDEMLQILSKETEQKLPKDLSVESKKEMLNALMLIRVPEPLDEHFIDLQDKLLAYENNIKGVIDFKQLKYHKNITHFHGDITRLNVEAIVNSINTNLFESLIYQKNDENIDATIVRFAGLQVREEIVRANNLNAHSIIVGTCEITDAYNLPSQYILHTVAPKIQAGITNHDVELLRACYLSCLLLAKNKKISSIAFPCLATKSGNFPKKLAAQTAVSTVKWFLKKTHSKLKIVFVTFDQENSDIYKDMLKVKE